MFRTLFVAILAFAAFTALPSIGFAGEEAPSVSYSLKKQGRVHFQNNAEDAVSSQEENTVDPAAIEPAAGGHDPVEAEEDALAKSMKLPRK